MELTKERETCLSTIAAAGGSMNHDDDRLAPFCDDASTLTTPDVFNQCHDAGWLISRHDGFLDSSIVWLTVSGWKALGVNQ